MSTDNVLKLVKQLKHMAGKHNQKLHAGSRGSSGGGSSSTATGFDKAVESLKPLGYKVDQHGTLSKKLTNAKDGRTVDVSVSKSGAKSAADTLQVSVTMRKSTGERVAQSSGTFFTGTAMRIAKDFTESGKFPSIKAVKQLQ